MSPQLVGSAMIAWAAVYALRETGQFTAARSWLREARERRRRRRYGPA